MTSRIPVCLPLQSCHPENIRLESPKRLKSIQPSVERSLSGFSYEDPHFTLTSLCLLLPPCPIVLWDSATGRLDVDLGTHAARFAAFQAHIVDCVESAYRSPKPYFHSMLHGTVLTAHIHVGSADVQKRTDVCRGTTWSHSLDLVKGQTIRLGIQFQGVCFLLNHETQERKYRLQHHVTVIYA